MNHLDQLIQELLDISPQLNSEQQDQLSTLIKKLHTQQPDIPLDAVYQAQLLQQLQMLQSQAKIRKAEGVTGWIRRYRTVMALVPLFALFIILGWWGNIFESTTPAQRLLTIPVAAPQPPQDTIELGIGTHEDKADVEGEAEELSLGQVAQKNARMLQGDTEPTAPLEELIEVADSVEHIAILEKQDEDLGGLPEEILHADSVVDLLQDKTSDDEDKEREQDDEKDTLAEAVAIENGDLVIEDIPAPSGIATLQAYIAAINAGQYDTAYSMLAERSKNLTSDIAWYEETASEREAITMDILEEYTVEDAEYRYSFITIRLYITHADQTILEHHMRYSLRQDIATEQRVMHAKD